MSYLKNKLKEKHITQAELGRRLGVTRQYICDLCRGRRKLSKMPVEKVCDIALILDLDIKEFIEEILKNE